MIGNGNGKPVNFNRETGQVAVQTNPTLGFSFLLGLQKLLLPANMASIAFRGHVFSANKTMIRKIEHAITWGCQTVTKDKHRLAKVHTRQTDTERCVH